MNAHLSKHNSHFPNEYTHTLTLTLEALMIPSPLPKQNKTKPTQSHLLRSKSVGVMTTIMTVGVLVLLTLCIALMAPSQSRCGVAAQLMTEQECTADSSRSTLTLSTFVTRIFACELPEGDGALMEERARRENTTFHSRCG